MKLIKNNDDDILFVFEGFNNRSLFVMSPPCVCLQLVKKEGRGTELPMTGDKVFVHYVGTLLDGTQFDSSRDRGERFSFELGKGGFDESRKPCEVKSC